MGGSAAAIVTKPPLAVERQRRILLNLFSFASLDVEVTVDHGLVCVLGG